MLVFWEFAEWDVYFIALLLFTSFIVEKNKSLLEVEVISPEGKLFVGSADAVTAVNEVGIFDVLPFHSRFVSIIKDYLLIHVRNGSKVDEVKQYDFEGKDAVLKCFDNKVSVYLGV